MLRDQQMAAVCEVGSAARERDRIRRKVYFGGLEAAVDPSVVGSR